MLYKYPNKKNLPHSQETPMAKKENTRDEKQTNFLIFTPSVTNTLSYFDTITKNVILFKLKIIYSQIFLFSQ